MPAFRAPALLLAIAASFAWADRSRAVDCGCHPVTDEAVAARIGWRTDWVLQLPFDASRFKLMHVAGSEDLIVAQTEDGGVHAIVASKGPTRGTLAWSRRVGEPNGPIHPASVGPTLVAVATDRTIHALRVENGSVAFADRFSRLVEAGPSEAGGSIYLPIAGGTIMQLAADPATNPSLPLSLAAHGALVAPVVPIGEKAVAWITTAGKVIALQPYADSWERSEMLLPAPGAGQPIARGDEMFIVTTAGDLIRIAIRRTAPVGLRAEWRIPLPGRPDGTMLVDGKTLFVSLGIDGIAAIDTDTGETRWHAHSPSLRFRDGQGLLAAGAGGIWVLDAVGRLALLDASDGSRIGCAPLGEFTLRVTSSLPGRLILASREGRLMALSPIGE